MEASVITLLFLLFAVVMFVWEKIPLGVTSMIVCIGLVVTGVLDWEDGVCRICGQQCHPVCGDVHCRGCAV